MQKFLLERGDKPEKGGVNVEMGGAGGGGCHCFYYFTVQFNRIYIFSSSVF